MPAVIEVEYFNTFWLKKIVDDGKQWGNEGAAEPSGSTPADRTSYQPIWPGSDPAGANVCGTNTSLSGGFGLGFYPLNRTSGGKLTPEAMKQEDRCWFIEESRIRGGFNNTSVDLGVRAYITEEAPGSFIRSSSMIYSGVFNSRTNVNETNQFPTGQDITKTADPHYGSIQKLYAEDGNLLIFQENKVSRALIDKDAVYSAEGQPMTTQSNVVIGQIQPYVGEYGISRNPESFAIFGYRKYFIDKDRGVVLRLSRDGMTEISSYGMSDFFRDNLSQVSDSKINYVIEGKSTVSSTIPLSSFTIGTTSGPTPNTGAPQLGSLVSVESNGIITNYSGCYVVGVLPTGSGYDIELSKSIDINSVNDTILFTNSLMPKLPGAWDIHNRCYTVSLQANPNYFPLPEQNINSDGEIIAPSVGYSTLNFDDSINGWVSFYTYNPTFAGSLKDKYYSFYQGKIYEHYSNKATTNNYQTFYGVAGDSSITFIFNPNPSISKNFLTINYEGSNGWEMDAMISGYQGYQTRPTAANTPVWSPVFPANLANNNWVQLLDSALNVRSYSMGGYLDTDGSLNYAGFNLKENKYVANLVNNSVLKPQEVLFNENGLLPGVNNVTSGIKGYFATVKMSTDNSTDPFGPKELFAVGSVYQLSSQ